MHQYQERAGEEARKPGGKTCKRDMETVRLKGWGCIGQDKIEWKNPKPFLRKFMIFASKKYKVARIKSRFLQQVRIG